ncbi:uncharacterized protein PHACADRAFT_150450 [Phanerochaete carnosa HHB-10118-sp]|uniref:Uncharacterized protein n=1 Tax=Phanerochaete carnosa (strain HHB-10118-sp) TaxID=650164 RepID=K5VY84_PHACS|nr:uncharacterized protein PHACADRAFT_150450 [Phanerochaete carnosa HHB-10118-sp]EKM51770.1 hypothetical protein PHACADRAFT_150450 [Phanerochaete carnosa HHB-10118-sp]
MYAPGENSQCKSFVIPGQDLLQPGKTEPSPEVSRTTPVLTGDALEILGPERYPQRALYGHIVSQCAAEFRSHPANPMLYVNTNTPFNALVCGVQGSGKSHSTAVLLEGCLIQDSRIGALPAPLSALVFYLDSASGSGIVQPCEAAYLAMLDAHRGGHAKPPNVTVLVLPPNLQAMRKVYSGLLNVQVEPLHFSPENISGERLLTMMRLNENSQLPIYMEAIMTTLRTMEHDFNYQVFRQKLDELNLKPDQRTMLNLRLMLLDSCFKGGETVKSVSSHFKKGQLTIVDLSSPFMDGESACGIFDLVLSLFVDAEIEGAGKLVVLDEAHKYLSETKAGSSGRLTDSVLTVVRQQRHLATRVIISTQEPTVVPTKFLDLSSFVIAHQFSSPAWMHHLSQHVSSGKGVSGELLSKIVSLEAGEALLFAPRGLGARNVGSPSELDAAHKPGARDQVLGATVAHIGQGYLHVKSRQRITRDGGHAILAVPDEEATRLGRVSVRAPPATGEPEKSTVAEGAAVMAREKNEAEGVTSIKLAFRVVNYVVSQFSRNDAASLSLDDIRKNFEALNDADIETVLQQAENEGFFRRQNNRILRPNEANGSVLSSPPNSSDFESRDTNEASIGIQVSSVVDYVKGRVNHGAPKLSIKNIRKYFANNQPVLSEADVAAALCAAKKAGQLVTKSKGGKQWITLPQKASSTKKLPSGSSAGPSTTSYSALTVASAAAVTAITFKGSHQRFAPLVRVVLASYSKQKKPVDVSTIQKHFQQSNLGIYGKKLRAYKQVATAAVSQGLLLDASGGARKPLVVKVAPIPGARYDF